MVRALALATDVGVATSVGDASRVVGDGLPATLGELHAAQTSMMARNLATMRLMTVAVHQPTDWNVGLVKHEGTH